MEMIKGQTIVLHEKTQVGVDDFNAPIWEENAVEVDNVIIEPASNDAIVSEIQTTGKHVVYILHIPKNDSHNWTDARVDFYGQSWKSFGDCMVYDAMLTPLSWNKKVKVERYE